MFRQALDAEPANSNVLTWYAVFAERRLQDSDLARDLYEKAIEADEENGPALMGLANLFSRNGPHHDVESADTYFQRAISLNATPDESASEPAARLGEYATFVATQLGDLTRAKHLYERSFDARAETQAIATHLTNYANILIALGAEEQDIIDAYERALVASPADTRAILHFAAYRGGIGDISGALALFETGTLIEPDLVWVACGLAESLFGSDRVVDAMTVLNWVASRADLDPDMKIRIAFLRMVHEPDGRESGMSELRQLIESGLSCERWSPDATVRWAEESSHPDVLVIRGAADVLTGRASPATLG